MSFDLVIKNGTGVIPHQGEARLDIGVKNGKVAALAADLGDSDTTKVLDAAGKHLFPGGVDAHYHLGIYRSLDTDAFEETRSSLVGGVTTVISYFRTGSHYLNKSGPYSTIFPEVLSVTDGKSHTDFAYHVAPMTTSHLDEIRWLIDEHGIASFKYYMFYKGLNLAADSTDAKSYTMADEYDLGHLYRIMQEVSAAARTSKSARVSLSIHCEQPELIRVFIDEVRKSDRPQDLAAYSDARPPMTERLSIEEATFLANETGCPVNLLHLSSREALDEAKRARRKYPDLDIRLETTVHHLALSYDQLEGLGGKVNPPIRTRADNDALWEGVASGAIDWVASDHACCMEGQKGDELWAALPGFGGTALLYPVLISEGHHERGIPLHRIAEVASSNPARAYGLHPRKGSIAVGSDADIALVDLEDERVITSQMLLSGQDHTPFAGRRVKGWPSTTILRGGVVLDQKLVTPPSGVYLRRIGLDR